MAKLPTMKAVIEIAASTEEAERKLTELEKIAKKIEKDGTAFKIEADESGMIQVKKIIDEIKADSKNKISFLELDESMHSMLVKYEKELKSTGEAVRKMFSDLMNGAKNVDIGGIVKGISPELDEINKKIKEQTALIEERNKVMADAKQKALQFQQIEKDSAKRIQDSYRKCVLEDKSDDRKKFAAEFKSYLDNDFNHSYLTHKGTGGESFDFEKYKQKYENILKRLPKSFNLDQEAAKISSGLNLPFSKDQHREYAKSFNTIKAEVEGLTSSLKELEAQKLKTEKQIELDRINKENLLNKNKLNDPKDLEEKIVAIKVDPTSLDKFYEDIENYKHAKIIVEPKLADGSDLKKDDGDIKKGADADKEEKKESSAIENVYKDLKSRNSIISEMNKILGDGSQNGFKNEDFLNLKALVGQYENVVGKFNDKTFNQLLEDWRIDIDEFQKGWNSANKKLEESVKKNKKETNVTKEHLENIVDSVVKDVDKVKEKENKNASSKEDLELKKLKEVYNSILKKGKEYKKKSTQDVGFKINDIIKQAIDSGSTLNDEQAKELVAMVEIWKNRKNTDGRSPIGSILKGYGVSKDNNLLGNYDTFKGQYEDYIKYLSEESKKNPPIIKPKVDTTDAKKDIDKLNEVIENGSKQQENSNLTENITDPIKKEAVIYKQIIADIENIISLQDRVNKGNRLLTDITSPNSLVDKSDTRGGYTTKKTIEKLLAKYDAIRSDNISAGLDGEHGLDKLKEKMVAYVALYKDITSAQKIFGKKHEYLWADPNNKGVGQQAGGAINSNIAFLASLNVSYVCTFTSSFFNMALKLSILALSYGYPFLLYECFTLFSNNNFSNSFDVY